MQVVGLTTPQEVYVASKERKFRINELLVIEDPYQGGLIGEVVESNSYNRFIPLSIGGAIHDPNVIESLKHLGYSISEDEINLAKVKLLSEAGFPVVTGSPARLPAFDEVRGFLLKGSQRDGLLLGEIKNTEETAATMEEELKGLCEMYTRGQISKTENVPFILDLRSFQQYPHIGIFGGSGSGKSFGLRVMMEEIMKHRFPALMLDPHYEMEFSEGQEKAGEKRDFKEDFKKFQIGEHIGVEFLNLSRGDLLALLSAVSPLTEAMASAVEVVHRRGDTYLSFSNRLELLSEALETGRSRIEQALKQDINPIDKEKYTKMRQLLEEYQNIPLPSVQGIAWRLRRLHYSGFLAGI